MPNARELLEQADALMRRNRKRGKGGRGDAPTPTAALDADASLAPTVILPEGQPKADPIVLDAPKTQEPYEPLAGTVSVAPQPANEDAMSLDTLADVPVLTDVVVPGRSPDDLSRFAGGSAATSHDLDADVATSSVVAAIERAALGDDNAFPASAAAAAAAAAHSPAPAIIEQAPSAPPPDATDAPAHAEPKAIVLDDDFILEIPPIEDGSRRVVAEEPPPIPAVASPPVDRDWDSIAEEIRMQVLQRLDLLTDAGLRDQLGAHLRPIVDRASSELVATINRELGELVRSYVAEAIEREIESWRAKAG
jgi:hypothetical protein